MKGIIRVIIVLVPLLFSMYCTAQHQGQQRIDSLLMELKSAKQDTNKVNLLNELSFTYYSINPDKGLMYGKDGLALAEKLNLNKFKKGWEKVIANSIYSLGVNYYARSDYPRTLECWLLALKIFEKLKDKQGIAKILANIGLVYETQNDYSKALMYYFKALRMDEELKNELGIAKITSNIGYVYMKKGDYSRSLNFELKSLKIFKKLGNKNGEAINLTIIGDLYLLQKENLRSLEYHLSALKLFEELGDKNGIAENLGIIGKIYLSIAKDQNKSDLNKLFEGSTTAALQKAKLNTKGAIDICYEIGGLGNLFLFYSQLSEIQTLLGDCNGALKSFKNYSLYKDSVFSLEKDKKLTQIGMQYEFDKKEAAIKVEQEKKDSIQRTIRYSTFLGLIGLLIFSIVVYIQRNKVRKEKARSEELLLNILPAEVAEELKAKGSAEAKDFNSVTVMFTDFKKFSEIGEKLTAQELVNEINFCYSAFDTIISKYGIEKIKTIGDSYMCAGGLSIENSTSAENTIRAALAIRDFMLDEKQKREAEGKTFFEIRIGCNTGSVVAGIVGIKKFAYDIWGDTVNIASRMESSGEAGKVNISNSTYELVKDKFTCIARGKVLAKNKGMIDMYFVES